MRFDQKVLNLNLLQSSSYEFTFVSAVLPCIPGNVFQTQFWGSPRVPSLHSRCQVVQIFLAKYLWFDRFHTLQIRLHVTFGCSRNLKGR